MLTINPAIRPQGLHGMSAAAQYPSAINPQNTARPGAFCRSSAMACQRQFGSGQGSRHGQYRTNRGNNFHSNLTTHFKPVF
jgi:hypothetical protein